MRITGKSADGYIDAFEFGDKKFCVGVSFQPEFNAKVGNPDKLITLFLSECLKGKN